MLRKCYFVLKLIFLGQIVSLLKLLETNAFHVPNFSGQGCSQEFSAKILKKLGMREHP